MTPIMGTTMGPANIVYLIRLEYGVHRRSKYKFLGEHILHEDASNNRQSYPPHLIELSSDASLQAFV